MAIQTWTQSKGIDNNGTPCMRDSQDRSSHSPSITPHVTSPPLWGTCTRPDEGVRTLGRGQAPAVWPFVDVAQRDTCIERMSEVGVVTPLSSGLSRQLARSAWLSLTSLPSCPFPQSLLLIVAQYFSVYSSQVPAFWSSRYQDSCS